MTFVLGAYYSGGVNGDLEWQELHGVPRSQIHFNIFLTFRNSRVTGAHIDLGIGRVSQRKVCSLKRC